MGESVSIVSIWAGCQAILADFQKQINKKTDYLLWEQLYFNIKMQYLVLFLHANCAIGHCTRQVLSMRICVSKQDVHCYAELMQVLQFKLH
jgi:hypothetical protein